MGDTWDSAAFRSRLAQAMEDEGNLTALAKRVGVHRSTLYEWRDGKREPSVGNAVALADALGWTLDYLAGRSPEPNARYGDEEMVNAVSELRQLSESLQRMTGGARQ